MIVRCRPAPYIDKTPTDYQTFAPADDSMVQLLYCAADWLDNSKQIIRLARQEQTIFLNSCCNSFFGSIENGEIASFLKRQLQLPGNLIVE
jgi:hypothetical protein